MQKVTVLERLRWAGAAFAKWVDALPPFWTVFALTLIEVVGGCVLALPIAFARLGPIGGAVVLFVLGVLNVLTLAAIAETVVRTGCVRYGNAYFGRIVAEYLGEAGAPIVTLALAVILVAVLIGYYIGFGTMLGSMTGVHPAVWVALLFALGLYFLTRGSLNSTIASAMFVGAVNLGLLLVLMLLALPHFNPALLSYGSIPFFGGAFDASIVELVFGVALTAYFGHTSVGNCARIVLRRDPSGRSLFWGAVSAQMTAVVLYCLWTIVVNGSISPDILAGEHGTALVPLAAVVGPIVSVLGLIFVTLGMGMGSISLALGLSSIVEERLPSDAHPVLMLARGHDPIMVRPRRADRDYPTFLLTYLGQSAHRARFRAHIQEAYATHRVEFSIEREWDVSTLFAAYPTLARSGLVLRLVLLDSKSDTARLQFITPMIVKPYVALDASGVDVLDWIDGTGEQAELIRWILQRRAVTASEIAGRFACEQAAAQNWAESLVKNGDLEVMREGTEVRYRARLRRKRASGLSAELWEAIETPAAVAHKPRGAAHLKERMGAWVARARTALTTGWGRRIVTTSPVLIIFVLTEALLLTGRESFTAVINLGGAISAPIFAGVFPALLLASSRRKGDLVPGFSYEALGHPVLLAVVYLIMLASLFAHGLIIWHDPVQQLAALASACVMIWLTIHAARHGAFSRRVIVRVHRNEGEPDARMQVTLGDHSIPAEVALAYKDGSQSVPVANGRVPDFAAVKSLAVRLPATSAREIKIWRISLLRSEIRPASRSA